MNEAFDSSAVFFGVSVFTLFILGAAMVVFMGEDFHSISKFGVFLLFMTVF
jgi:hypothetical protein